MRKNDFKVSAPSLLGATFSVKTTADDEPIIAKVDERGHWFFTVPKDLPARLLDKVQDVCETQFSPSVWQHIFGDPDAEALKFFDEAQALIPSKGDDIEDLRKRLESDIWQLILNNVDEADLSNFKDFFTAKENDFESMAQAMSKLIFYKQFKNKEI